MRKMRRRAVRMTRPATPKMASRNRFGSATRSAPDRARRWARCDQVGGEHRDLEPDLIDRRTVLSGVLNSGAGLSGLYNTSIIDLNQFGYVERRPATLRLLLPGHRAVTPERDCNVTFEPACDGSVTFDAHGQRERGRFKSRRQDNVARTHTVTYGSAKPAEFASAG